MPKTGFAWAALGAGGEEKGNVDHGISVTAAGLQPGRRGRPGRAVTPLGRHMVSGCSEGTATLALSLSSEARSPGQDSLGGTAGGVYFHP